tara:strand:- start:8 stop:1723 length:1716 start_codon:yes stop_codon:yes gene_type:complete
MASVDGSSAHTSAGARKDTCGNGEAKAQKRCGTSCVVPAFFYNGISPAQEPANLILFWREVFSCLEQEQAEELRFECVLFARAAKPRFPLWVLVRAGAPRQQHVYPTLMAAVHAFDRYRQKKATGFVDTKPDKAQVYDHTRAFHIVVDESVENKVQVKSFAGQLVDANLCSNCFRGLDGLKDADINYRFDGVIVCGSTRATYSADGTYTVDTTCVADTAFKFCSHLTSANLERCTADRIGAYMFAHCRQLETVRMSMKIAQIGHQAFSNCDALKHIRLDAVVVVAEKAFYNTPRLQHVTFGPPLARIDKQAFEESGLLNLYLPHNHSVGVLEVHESAFAFCESLHSVFVPTDTMLGPYVFDSAGVLNVHFGHNVILGDGCFHRTHITHVAFTKAVIGCHAFADTPLQSLAIWESADICAHAFAELAQLETVSLGQTKNIGDGAFFHTGITRLAIVGQGGVWGESCFAICEDLTHVTLPMCSVIPERMFQGCVNLKSVDTIDEHGIPYESSATLCDLVVGDYAFAKCEELSRLNIPNIYYENSEIPETAFMETNFSHLCDDENAYYSAGNTA